MQTWMITGKIRQMSLLNKVSGFPVDRACVASTPLFESHSQMFRKCTIYPLLAFLWLHVDGFMLPCWAHLEKIPSLKLILALILHGFFIMQGREPY